MDGKTFYLTTPLYYVNAEPHIGHAYTTVLADVMIRFRKNLGEKTFFLTGTDEHGAKVASAAEKAGITPKEYADNVVKIFKKVWSKLNIEYDFFIRTTDDFHKKVVAEALDELNKKGDIYADTYTGEYCTPCERFWSPKDLQSGNCPDCGRKTNTLEEKNYFFKMSKYQQALIDHINKNPKFIVPESRRNEVLGFLQNTLADLCISRPKERLSWGIEIPFDKNYVTYVWFDALLNYVTAVGYKQDEAKFKSLWPANYHLIGKDIITTHAVYWSTMLMALGLELPKTILAHGWWLSSGDKMSKSKGNVEDPLSYADKYGVDIFRYFLLKEMKLGTDANFTNEIFLKVVNSDLANDIGNLISRTSKMILSYFAGIVPKPKLEAKDQEIKNNGDFAIQEATKLFLDDKPGAALETVMEFIRKINKYIVEEEPWTLAKDNTKKERLATVLYTAAESIRLGVEFMKPVMPSKCAEALSVLGADSLEYNLLKWGALKEGCKVKETTGLFPRILA